MATPPGLCPLPGAFCRHEEETKRISVVLSLYYLSNPGMWMSVPSKFFSITLSHSATLSWVMWFFQSPTCSETTVWSDAQTRMMNNYTEWVKILWNALDYSSFFTDVRHYVVDPKLLYGSATDNFLHWRCVVTESRMHVHVNCESSSEALKPSSARVAFWPPAAHNALIFCLYIYWRVHIKLATAVGFLSIYCTVVGRPWVILSVTPDEEKLQLSIVTNVC